MSRARCRAAVLVSGSGTNLQAFIDAAGAGRLDLELALVVSNVAGAYGLERAAAAGIAHRCIEHGSYTGRVEFDRAVAGELDRADTELVILAGFMRILSPWFVDRYEGRILNIHPALLPRYPGLDTHERVLEAGDRKHGSTVHFVTDVLDGGPRILQGRIGVSAGDTPETLRSRVQSVEHRIYPRAAQWYAEGRLTYRDGQALLDDQPLARPVVIDFD